MSGASKKMVPAQSEGASVSEAASEQEVAYF
jgi:hypothetical protein